MLLLFQSGTPLQLVSEAVRSMLAISDLFTEKAQFQWMLATCLELGKHHPFEDEILHQYLVLGSCKAAAVLGPVSVCVWLLCLITMCWT
jgi:huntingtin